MEIAFLFMGYILGAIKGIYLGGIKGRRRGRIRVLTHFSLSYRFLIILPVSELVVYRVLDDRVEKWGRLRGSRESRWKGDRGGVGGRVLDATLHHSPLSSLPN